MVHRSVVRTCCGIGLALLCLARPADADGWKIQMQGLKAMGSAYAGRSVLVEDASTIWFNPAGMLKLEDKWTITVGAPVITYQLEFRDAGSRSVLGQPLQGEAVQDGGRTAVVPHVYIVRRIGSRWRAGFGFNAPFGLGTDYGETWVGRYHATETTLTVFNMNPSVAVRLNDRVSIGGGFDLQRSTGTLANMIDFGIDRRRRRPAADAAAAGREGRVHRLRLGSRVRRRHRYRRDANVHAWARPTVRRPRPVWRVKRRSPCPRRPRL